MGRRKLRKFHDSEGIDSGISTLTVSKHNWMHFPEVVLSAFLPCLTIHFPVVRKMLWVLHNLRG
jgi:hypothetical protein